MPITDASALKLVQKDLLMQTGLQRVIAIDTHWQAFFFFESNVIVQPIQNAETVLIRPCLIIRNKTIFEILHVGLDQLSWNHCFVVFYGMSYRWFSARS